MKTDRLRVFVAALGIAFVLAIVLGASGVLTPKNQRTALGASTTLAILSGAVQVRHGATGDFVAADDGMVLAPGDTVRTGADARAVLTYFEGSTVEIEPASELAIQVAHGNPDGSTVIEMQQQLGVTWHVVTHLVQGNSKYEVHTTAATASVRGTQFTVGVEPDGTTTETTSEGAVANTDAQNITTVVTPPGQQTTTKQGQAPEPPKPAPEPERKLTVTITDPNALVVDALGRANGIDKDGKKIVQTPGAQVSLVDGKIVVTLPDPNDGDIATHFQKTGGNTTDVVVTTTVEQKGKAPVQVTETVKPAETAVTGVELKKTTTTAPISVGGATVTATTEASIVQLKKITEVKAPKVGEIPPTPTVEQQQQATEINNGVDTSGKKTDVTGTTTATNQNNDNNTTTTTTPGDTVGTTVNTPTKNQTTTTSSEAEAKLKEAQKKLEEEQQKAADEAKKKLEQGGFTVGPIVPIQPVPNGPTVPNAPTVPNGPAVPNVPTVPNGPTVPNVPTVPNAPTVPNVPAVPNVPTVPNGPAVPNVPAGPPSNPNVDTNPGHSGFAPHIDIPLPPKPGHH